MNLRRKNLPSISRVNIPIWSQASLLKVWEDRRGKSMSLLLQSFSAIRSAVTLDSPLPTFADGLMHLRGQNYFFSQLH